MKDHGQVWSPGKGMKQKVLNVWNVYILWRNYFHGFWVSAKQQIQLKTNTSCYWQLFKRKYIYFNVHKNKCFYSDYSCKMFYFQFQNNKENLI